MVGGRSSALFSLESPVLKITGLTVPTLRSFVKTITEPIIRGVARANRSEVEDEVRKPVVTKPRAALNSGLVVLTNHVTLEVFRYHFKDNESVGLVMKGISLFIDLSQNSAEILIRRLKFRLRPIVLARKIYDTNKKVPDRDILKLPTIQGDLETNERADLTVEYNFITAFEGPIEPSAILPDYEMTLATIRYLVGNLTMGNEDGRRERGDQRKSKAPPADKKPPYKFVPVKYDFDPSFKVAIGVSLSPNVAWLLGQLGIADEHIIPASLFEFICLGLEEVVRRLEDVIN
jgi:hypothetical protein